MLCDKCKQIAQQCRGAPGHSDLESMGIKAATLQPYGQSRVNIKKFRCRGCGALWSYTDDKNDAFEGWSLEASL